MSMLEGSQQNRNPKASRPRTKPWRDVLLQAQGLSFGPKGVHAQHQRTWHKWAVTDMAVTDMWRLQYPHLWNPPFGAHWD